MPAACYCAIYSTEVDIVPDPQANTHHPSTPARQLNTTETLFPGTELRLIYDFVSSKDL
jgi:hypothetical protein